MTAKYLRISMLSYFYIAVVLDGLQRLSGLFVVELTTSMNVTRQYAVVPYIFSWAVANIIASFSDILIESKYLEYVILFGVLLCAAGAALCILATNITMVIVFWGFMFGSGYGLASPLLMRRLKSVQSTKLSSILQVTPSIGVSIMPFVLYVLIEYYGLQGSYLIFSGIILHYVPLAIAAAYNIKIYIPNIRWRVRKKSNEYFVSKQEGNNANSIESFINSLEPDLIVKINQSDEHQYESNSDSSEFSTKNVFPAGRKRSETRGNDLQGLEINTRMFSRYKSPSQMVSEIENYEKREQLFEESFSSKDIIYEGIEHKGFNSSISVNCDIPENDKTSEKNRLSPLQNDLNLKNEILHQISECEIKDIVNENEELRNNSYENYTVNDINDLANSFMALKNTNTYVLNENKDNNILHNDERQENAKEESKPPSSQKLKAVKSLDKETVKLSPHSLENKITINIPLDIKVHVEECTFTTDDEHWNKIFNSNCLKAKSSSSDHSNSVLIDIHKNFNFTSPIISKKNLTHSVLCKPKLSNIYSISENSELDDKRTSVEKKNKKQDNTREQNNNGNQIKLKFIRTFKFLNEITSPVCFFIILITIIFEMNLVVLLSMFADFGNIVHDDCSDFKWILVAFGVGGLIGKLCYCKISRTIPEKSHAIGVVLFLLAGLSIAGVLYSPSLNWLSSFYCILGGLEGGITYIVPKFIMEYTQRDIHSTLSSVKSFLSGVAVICIPFIISLFPDELGDYEFLLQTLSCSSVLCAFLAYFLPNLRVASDKQITPSFKGKIETI